MTGHEAYLVLLEASIGKLNEDNLDAYLNLMHQDDRNGEYAKALRTMNVYNSKLHRGAITQSQLDAKHKQISDRCKTRMERDGEWFVPPVPKDGTASISKYTGARPNRERSPMPPDAFGDIGKSYRGSKNVDPVTAEKLKRHLSILRSTDNYGEYKSHHAALNKLIGAAKGSTIMAGANAYKNNADIRVAQPSKTAVTATADDNLYHTSKVNNISHLRPVWKSSDGALYPNKRVYFNAGRPGNRVGGTNGPAESDSVYQYTGKGVLRPDTELNTYGYKPGAFYLDTDKRLPVKKISG